MTAVKRRSLAREQADGAERGRRNRAYFDLMDAARMYPSGGGDASTVRRVADRSGRSEAEVRRIIRAYQRAPHRHAVATWHMGGTDRACSAGPHHPGCCPGERGCDAPGELPR